MNFVEALLIGLGVLFVVATWGLILKKKDYNLVAGILAYCMTLGYMYTHGFGSKIMAAVIIATVFSGLVAPGVYATMMTARELAKATGSRKIC